MKTKHLTRLFAAFVLLALPAVSSASVYQYIDTSGNLKSVEAASASEAIATAPNLALHSGVILGLIYGTDGSLETTDKTTVSGSYYQYVDVNGNIRSIEAPNASIAIATAPGIAQNSGVILVNNSSKLGN